MPDGDGRGFGSTAFLQAQFLKRYTLQVAPLRYPSPTHPKYTEYSSTDLLCDFNTEDLYTKYRTDGQWEGNYPQYERTYGNSNNWISDYETIRPVKGTPLRLRKIPLCTRADDGDGGTIEATGYFYTLATAPFIIEGYDSNNDEVGYLADWDPNAANGKVISLSDCVSGDAATPVTGTGCAHTYNESIDGTVYTVVSGECITGTGCAHTYNESIDGHWYTVVSGRMCRQLHYWHRLH